MLLNQELIAKQAISRMRIDNPWWTEGKVLPQFGQMKPRMYFEIFYPLVKKFNIHRALILMGPRRVGKTVMIYHTIQRLIDEGVDPKSIVFISVETPIYNGIGLEQLLALARLAVNKGVGERMYVFFDEVQYLKEWELHLKVLVDTYPNVKFVASGSASVALKVGSMESGAGRFTDFSLPPLMFCEYLHLRGYSSLMYSTEMEWHGQKTSYYNTTDIKKLNSLFVDYLNFGGYPEVAFNTELQTDPGQYIRHDIIDKVLLRDLPSLYGISDVQELNSFFTMLAYLSGGQFSFDGLSKESGVKKETVKKYIQYLEAAFLLKVIHRSDDTAKRYQREINFKVYLTNPSLRCALFEPITVTDEYIGNVVETAVYSQWIPRLGTELTYAGWQLNRKEKGEVDIVGVDRGRQKPSWAVELKWSDRYFKSPKELVSLRYFMEKNHLHEAIVTSITQSGRQELPWGNLQFIPSACYAFLVGLNTLNMTKNTFGT